VISCGIESRGGDDSTSFFASPANGSSVAKYSGAIKVHPSLFLKYFNGL
jgi:hypothetical protein